MSPPPAIGYVVYESNSEFIAVYQKKFYLKYGVPTKSQFLQFNSQ